MTLSTLRRQDVSHDQSSAVISTSPSTCHDQITAVIRARHAGGCFSFHLSLEQILSLLSLCLAGRELPLSDVVTGAVFFSVGPFVFEIRPESPRNLWGRMVLCRLPLSSRPLTVKMGKLGKLRNANSAFKV